MITKTFRLSLINVPDNLPLNNAEVLVEQIWLAPTASVFEKLYQTLYEVGERLTPLLYDLICIRPALLNENYELVLYTDEEFARSLTQLILNGDKISDEDCISILNLLWEKDEAQLSDWPFLSQHTLACLSKKLNNDGLKQALLMQCLKDGSASPAFIR